MPSSPPALTPGKSREQLVGLLSEGAEIEHNLMCCYLYAAFSLKESTSEGVTELELAAIRRWRRVILDIAVEEMLHLTMVANIQCALGMSPHFGRQNFPIDVGAHPAGIVVKLAPFNQDTLDHFIYLERPEGETVADGKGFEHPKMFARVNVEGRIMPMAHDYDTVGQLYKAVENGLRDLVAERGESAVFVGDPARQIGADTIRLPGVARVLCLKTAIQAIDAIVVQGEGSKGDEKSHYCRFKKVKDEYEQLLKARPEFVPGRPAAHNPVMRPPPRPEGRVWIQKKPAADILDIANSAYNSMLRLLVQGYADLRGPAAQKPMVQTAIDLMRIITPLASVLTRLPANDGMEGCTAGMSFATVRGLSALPAGTPADAVLVERLREIVVGAERVKDVDPRLASIPEQLTELADSLEESLRRAPTLDIHLATSPAAAPAVATQAAAPPPTPPAPPATTVSAALAAAPKPAKQAESAAASSAASATAAATTVDGVEAVDGHHVKLMFEAKRCIHARHCVLTLPDVFKANVVGPWLDPDACSTEALAMVAHLCPSGAIRLDRKDGAPQEANPPVNLVQLRENGPLGVRGELVIRGKAAGVRATLCRCGASKNKPYCDGSHHEVSFVATAEPLTRESEPLAVRNGPLRIHPETNGPYTVRGNLEICAGTGRTVDRVTSVRMCRCGHSANKPFCDNSHERVGFVAD